MGGHGSGRKDRTTEILNKTQKLNPIAVTRGDDIFLPNHSGDHSRGRVRETATIDEDLVNKKYVDDNDADTTYLGGTNLTLSGTTFNVDDAFLKNDANDTGVGLILTGDRTDADEIYVPNVLFNTDITPPTASTVPRGTIYIQYTA